MGYLDNSTITVDAILTKRGRELLAQGRGQVGGASAFQITRFALADDEIDYDLWNPAHPLGSNYYGAVIENMPITEAVPDETQSMKYKLMTLPIGTRAIPYIAEINNLTSVDIYGANTSVTSTTVTSKKVQIATYQYNATRGNEALTDTQTYTVTLLDGTYVTLQGLKTSRQPSMSGNSISYSQVGDTADSAGALTMEFTVAALPITKAASITTPIVKTTKIIITNEKFGSRLVLPVTFTY